MLSCLVPRFGQEDKINSIMPSSPPFAMQFPSLASGIPKDDENSAPHSDFFLKCPQCHQNFINYQALKDHVDSVHLHGNQQEQYHSQIGSSNTPSPPLQNIHHHHHHPQHHHHHHHPNSSTSSLASQSTNDECGRSTSPSTSSSIGGSHACSQCPASFPNRDSLDKHELMHSPNSTVSCKICHKTFANVYRLQRHMISHDESALLRKFKCTDCDKAFKFKHHLKEHVRIHSGEKPFACNNCGKRFSHSGSYSSHMTSKKCISMGLKLNNNRILVKPEKNIRNMKDEMLFASNKARVGNFLTQNISGMGLNNNNTNNQNHNNFLSMLPKCNNYDAMNAALFASFPNPFIPMTFDPRNAFNPYNLQRLIELTAATSPHNNSVEAILKSSPNFLNKTPSLHSDPEDMIEEVTEDVNDEPKLVMDLEEDEKSEKNDLNTKPIASSREITEKCLNNNDNIIHDYSSQKEVPTTVSETVSQSVNSNAHCTNKLERELSMSPELIIHNDDSNKDETLQCSRCDKTFNHRTELAQHESILCGMFRKHEGLAAQMAETIALNGTYLSIASGSEDEDRDSRLLSEGERKVRVRTAISEDQQAILKEHYAVNPRPNRDEFRTIAQRLSLDPRVVQVWFQNNRSRERKLNNIPFKKDYSVHPPLYGSSASPSLSSPLIDVDQPLDLSIKKELSATSSPSSSPNYNSGHHQSDNSISDEVMNLSLKTESRVTPPYRQLFNYGISLSNHSSESQTPSPHHGHPAYPYMLSNSALGLVPMERLLQMTPDLPRNHLLNLKSERDSSLSPGSEKRLWKDENIRLYDTEKYMHHIPKRINTQKEPEIEGQYVCDQCDKAFSKQSSLARHKYEHSGQRPYKCAECPKAFKHKHHLTEHKRLHSGEKPFQCAKCLKRFSHSGSYSQHMNHRYSYCKPYRE